jgi:hypothetical protein
MMAAMNQGSDMKVILKDSGAEVLLASTPEYQEDFRAWTNSRCTDHPTSEWRRRPTAGGGMQIKQQCLTCGGVFGNARKQHPSDIDLPLVDQHLHERYEFDLKQRYEDMLQKHALKQHTKSSSFFKSYSTYLSGPEWGLKRKLVLERAGGLCEGCRTNGATEVHHLSYAHVGKEFLFELVAVCRECHDRLHEVKPAADLQNEATTNDVGEEYFPCGGCRYFIETNGIAICAANDQPAEESVAVGGRCGPELADFEPLK